MDKLANIAFVVTVAVFLYVWQTAVHLDIYSLTRLHRVVTVIWLVAGVALIIWSIITSIAYAESHTALGTGGEYQWLDQVELVLSVLLLFLTLTLTVYVLVTCRWWLRHGGGGGSEGKSLGLVLAMSILSTVLVLVRVVLVFLAAYDVDTSYGWSIYYGVNVLTVEGVIGLMMMLMVTSRFISDAPQKKSELAYDGGYDMKVPAMYDNV